MERLCDTMETTTIAALIDGDDDVIQRPRVPVVADVDKALVVVTGVDTSSSEEEEAYGVDWELYPNVPSTVSWAWTKHHESTCQGCGEAKYTQAKKGERKKLVPFVSCNMCNFVWHHTCLTPVMPEDADQLCFFACSNACKEEATELME